MTLNDLETSAKKENKDKSSSKTKKVAKYSDEKWVDFKDVKPSTDSVNLLES